MAMEAQTDPPPAPAAGPTITIIPADEQDNFTHQQQEETTIQPSDTIELQAPASAAREPNDIPQDVGSESSSAPKQNTDSMLNVPSKRTKAHLKTFGVTRVTAKTLAKKVAQAFRGPFFCFFAILMYIFLGAIAFSELEDTQYYPHSVYWAVVTLFTVGYGDMVPTTPAMKAFTCVYILIGITGIVSCISVITSAVTESRLQIRAARRVNDKIDRAESLAKSTVLSLVKDSTHVAVDNKETGKDEDGSFLPHLARQAAVVVLKIFAVLFFISFIGITFFMRREDLGFADAIYLTIVTLSTVGYGDIPLNETSRNFMIIFIFFCVPMFTASLSLLVQQMNQVLELRRVKKWTSQGVTRELLFEADKDGNGTVDRQEFTLYYLEKLGRLDSADLELIRAMFDRYDRDGSGVLDINDLPVESATKDVPC